MSRAVTEDHILFDECIKYFRSEFNITHSNFEEKKFSCILTDFIIPEEWNLIDCKVRPSIDVHVAGPYKALISKVENKQSSSINNSFLYGVALASIFTFATGRLCKSVRDGYEVENDNFTESNKSRIALNNPILYAGPGGTSIHLESEILNEYQDKISKTIDILLNLPYKKYLICMQAIRLLSLSLYSKREDFGLAYLLCVSAIEAIAQNAIKRDKVKREDLNEKKWKTKANDDPDFSELLKRYKEAKGMNQYLKERYIYFIKTYAPPATWQEINPHPGKKHFEFLKKSKSKYVENLTLPKYSFERYPEDISEIEIEKILSESYNHRSYFVHRGQQPPHTSPTPRNWFFENQFKNNEAVSEQVLLPNYDLMFNIASHSIFNWMKTL